jgi:hypothetical protein
VDAQSKIVAMMSEIVSQVFPGSSAEHQYAKMSMAMTEAVLIAALAFVAVTMEAVTEGYASMGWGARWVSDQIAFFCSSCLCFYVIFCGVIIGNQEIVRLWFTFSFDAGKLYI